MKSSFSYSDIFFSSGSGLCSSGHGWAFSTEVCDPSLVLFLTSEDCEDGSRVLLDLLSVAISSDSFISPFTGNPP